MIFSLENVINSLAGILKRKYPNYPVYDSASPQDTEFPCFFVFFMPSSMEDQIGGRFIRDLGVDIVFVQQRNIVNGNAQFYEIAEYLDEALDKILYDDGGSGSLFLHALEREWKLEDQELHYQFHIRPRVSFQKNSVYMQKMEEENVNIKTERD